MSMSEEVAKEYASSLADLTANSKPVINMLTMVAEENIEHASVIVAIVEKHLAKVQVDIKLLVLFLVDSIVKNVGGAYIQYFSLNIINMFTQTFQKVGMKGRSQMFKLRNTWNGVFSASKLYQLDVKVNLLDPAWPIPAQPPVTTSNHVTPVPNLHLPVPTAPVAMVNPVRAIAPNVFNIKPVNAVPRRNNTNTRDPRLAESHNARPEIMRARETTRLARDTRWNCSHSPNLDPAPATQPQATLSPGIISNKDVHLRVLDSADTETNVVSVGKKKPSPESSESISKKSKPDKFNVLFGNEDVDRRQLPLVEEKTFTASPNVDSGVFLEEKTEHNSPLATPRENWIEAKEQEKIKKNLSKLDPVEAIDTENFEKTIHVIMHKAKEEYSAGRLTNNQYRTVMAYVLKLKEKIEQNEAKQRQSLQTLKLMHKAHIEENVQKINSLRVYSKGSNFGEIDERVSPPALSKTDAPIRRPDFTMKSMNGPHHDKLWPRPPGQPFHPAHLPGWRGPYRSHPDDFPQRPRGAVPPHFRGKCDRAPRFDPRVPFVQPISTPQPLRAPHLPLITQAGLVPIETGRKAARSVKSPSSESDQLEPDMIASLSSDYSFAEPLFRRPAEITGLNTFVATPVEIMSAPPPVVPDVHDLIAKLVANGIIKAPAQTEKAKKEPKIEDEKPKEARNVTNQVDLSKLEALRVSRPALVTKLYDGMQCGSCGMRFPAKHTALYSRHLDWHFLQNHRERNSTRRASRAWYCGAADWLRHDRLEDSQETEKSWFETMKSRSGAAAAPALPPPSVPAGPSARAACAVCGDPFLHFYHEDLEEWHLTNSVSHEGQNYHPLCLKDYKRSLLKQKCLKPSVTSVSKVEKPEESIRNEDLDEALDQSDKKTVIKPIVSEEIGVAVTEPPTPLEAGWDANDETTAARETHDRRANIGL